MFDNKKNMLWQVSYKKCILMNNFKVGKNKDSNRCSLRSWNNAKCTTLEIFSSLVITILYQ